ncbi:MAG: PKD domain-containing protein [Candidatus Poseidoniaceae archaeon]|jgi:hypothetical protein|nr:PKD domain-containing protein [Candidatus Poseidoniaceae archaeon]
MKPIFVVLLFISSALTGCLASDEEPGADMEAVFSYSPSENIREGQNIEFDGSASLPMGVSLTYKWDFQDDGSVDETGRYASWSYPIAGEYDVRLTVSDGISSKSQTRKVTIIAADAVIPEAEAGSFTPNSDCDGESVNGGSYYLYYICEMDRDLSNKRVESTTTVTLDGSNSDPGANDEFIATWEWDLDLYTDSDGDGDPENDVDDSGETVEWKEVEPGEYKISLTVTNGADYTDTDEVVVYVNYVGQWNEFQIGGGSGNNPTDMEFKFSVTQDVDNGNTIRRSIGELIYPKEDSDCIDTCPGDCNNCRAKIDIFGYNSTDEEIANTSETGLDQRTAGDCDDSTDCVWLQFTGSYHFSESQHKDGEWTYIIRNEMVNDLEIESFAIRLVYK